MPISRNILKSIGDSLSSGSQRYAGHPSIDSVLKQLPEFESDDPLAIRNAYNGVARDLAKLVRDGILDQKVLESLEKEVYAITAIPKEEEFEHLRGIAEEIMKQRESDISVILFPGLPLRYREGVNVAFTLRALALHPRRVLPPGKSLTSLFMMRPDNKTEEERKREEAIAEVIKKAYWDAALEQLSSSQPDIYMPRIKTFHHDLYDALQPFVNRNNPLMVSLSSPLSPSSNPLASALNYLRATLVLMRTLCAPVRDRGIDSTIAAIDKVDKLHAAWEELAKAYVFGMRSALDIAQIMVEDRHAIMAKYGDESNVKAMLRATAKEQERDAITAAFGMDKLHSTWKIWSMEKTGPYGWTNSLVDIIGNLDSLMLNPDLLPPILQIHRVELAEVQSLLLGVIVAASIRTLVPLLPVNRQTLLYQGNQEALDVEAHFMQRLWTLLGADPFNNTEAFKEGDLDNLAVEVSRVWKQRNPSIADPSTKEKELAEIIKKMVADEDHPVRVLLKKRVIDAIKERLAQPMLIEEHRAPTSVAAGRAVAPRIKLKSGKPFIWEAPEVDMTVLGFTDPELKKHLRHIVHILRLVEGWVEYVWDDIV